MSSNDNVLNTANQQITNFDSSKLLLGGNDYITGDYTNSTYVDVDLTAGRVMARIAATDKIVPLASGASDGSQFPIGVLANDVTIPAGTSKDLSIAIRGQVASELVTFGGSDNMDTVVSSRRLEDWLGDRLILSGSDELTGLDNQ